MKKKLPRLTLRFESLRALDGPSVAGLGATDAATCPTSCPPTCGVAPATTNQAAVALNSARVCCV